MIVNGDSRQIFSFLAFTSCSRCAQDFYTPGDVEGHLPTHDLDEVLDDSCEPGPESPVVEMA